MGFFGRQLLKVIDWEDDSTDTIVYRFPMQEKSEIMMGSKLTVRESQAAVFVNKGQIADIFPPGLHKLEARNIPILTALNSWKYGFNSPFKAEVYFVNTRQFLNQKWGTVNPIMMRDADFGVVRLRGFGSFSYRVAKPDVFLKEVFGTSARYTTAGLTNYLKSILIAGMSDSIAESKISAIDLAGSILEFGEGIKDVLQNKFDALGLELCEFIIENLSLPEEVEKAMDTRTSMGVMGDSMDSFMQYQAAHAMRDAAQNTSGGNFASAGLGFGAGGAIGNMFASAMNGTQDTPVSAAATLDHKSCPHCGAHMRKTAKYCPDCGKDVSEKVCPKCASKVRAGAKFCPECGAGLSDKICAKCGAKMRAGAKFCPECGQQV